MGQTRKKQLFRVKSAFTAEADIFPCPNDVGFGPILLKNPIAGFGKG